MNKPLFAFDLNITQSCNLRCKYCIQDFGKKLKVMDPAIIKHVKQKINFLLENKDFRNIYDGVVVFFWGGEPSTQPKIIEDFIEYYKDNDRVKFYIYSNGYNLKGLYPTLLKYKSQKIFNNENKYDLQISFDGTASHDEDRVDVNGKGTASKVKKTIYELASDNINFGIHPTLALKNFDKIFDNYMEFKELAEELFICDSYSPTIDYLTDYSYLTREQLESVKNKITEQVKKIAKYEIEYYKKHNRFFLGWLNNHKALCGAAYNLQAVDQDGSVRACHGAFYLNEKDKQELTFNSIFYSNEIFLEKLLQTYNNFHKYSNYIPDGCKNCYATYCMKCNTAKFSNSKKTDKYEKWSDYTNQGYLCELYRHITKLRYGLLKLI